jgi:phosphoribosylformylglycinamidine synthase
LIRLGRVPVLDLELERAVQAAALRAAEAGLLRSAHDCSDGGISVALAELCFSSLNRGALGADIELPDQLRPEVALFSESPSRIIISFDEAVRAQVEEIAAQAGCPFHLLGQVRADRLRIVAGGAELIALGVDDLERAWRSSLGSQLQAEALVAAAE